MMIGANLTRHKISTHPTVAVYGVGRPGERTKGRKRYRDREEEKKLDEGGSLLILLYKTRRRISRRGA